MEKVKLMNMCKIIDKKSGCVLVQERIKSWQGIAFPGGKIEEGEAIVPSVIREVFEETGLKISDLKLCGLKDWYDKKNKERFLVFLFTASEYEGELTEETNEGKVYWMKESELSKQKLADDFYELLKVFSDETLNEMVYQDNLCDDENSRWELKLY